MKKIVKKQTPKNPPKLVTDPATISRFQMQEIMPQKARGKLLPEMWTDPAWSAENKHDGERRVSQFLSRIRFTGAKESVKGGVVEKTDCLPHLNTYKDTKQRAALEGTVLDGEIVAPYCKDLPGGKSKYVTSIMGSSPAEAVRKQQERGWLQYVVFDCLFHKGQDARDKPLSMRRILMLDALNLWDNPHVLPIGWINTDAKKEYYNRILAAGGEGVILKHESHTYGDEKLWVKVKGRASADVVVMGFTAGEGKYKGQVGSIAFGQYKGKKLEPYGTCAGFDDALRKEMTRKPKAFLGRVLEIEHYGREPTGAFRHPQFKRWRDDKQAKSCVYREDET